MMGDVGMVVMVLNFASIPVGDGEWLMCVMGAWSLALAASGGVITDGRGLFSTIARMSGDRDRSSGVQVRTEAVADGTLAASLASAARCPAADDSVRVTSSAMVLEGAIVVMEGVLVTG